MSFSCSSTTGFSGLASSEIIRSSGFSYFIQACSSTIISSTERLRINGAQASTGVVSFSSNSTLSTLIQGSTISSCSFSETSSTNFSF